MPKWNRKDLDTIISGKCRDFESTGWDIGAFTSLHEIAFNKWCKDEIYSKQTTYIHFLYKDLI